MTNKDKLVSEFAKALADTLANSQSAISCPDAQNYRDGLITALEFIETIESKYNDLKQ